MKLLFDQNLSPKLVSMLADVFPTSSHVLAEHLDTSDDDEVWDFALRNDFTIVTKDQDYDAMSVTRGWPPKILWLQIGNCTTKEVEEVIRKSHSAITDFEADATVGTLVIR